MTSVKIQFLNVMKPIPVCMLLLIFGLGIVTGKYVLSESEDKTGIISPTVNGQSISLFNQYQKVKATQEQSANLGLVEQASAVLELKSSGQFNKIAHKLTQSPPSILNDSMLNITLGSWAMEDAMAALKFALSQENQTKLADLVMSISGKNQDPLILKWLLENRNHPQYAYLVQSYFVAFATIDPVLALDKMQSSYPEKEQGNILMSIIDAWAKQDAEAVFTWLDSREKNVLTLDLQNTAMNHYIKQNPQDAAIAISLLRKGDNKNQLISSVADALSKQNIYEAIEWAENLPKEEQVNAISTVMSQWVINGAPDTALDYLLAREELQSNATVLNSAISSIAQTAPSLLMNRLSEFSNNSKEVVIKEIAIALLYQGSHNNYETWYQSLPVGSQREAASIPVVEANLRKDPELAFKYAENIVSMNDRKRYLTEAARSWANYDIAQAQFAIESSAVLTVAQKNEILEEIQN